jgi:hypothetical protein
VGAGDPGGGVAGLRFHDLRHTAATLALAAGANTRELMERMGHSSPQVALRYQHVMAGRDQAIAAALDELVQAAAVLVKDQPPAASGMLVARKGRANGTGAARGSRRRRPGVLVVEMMGLEPTTPCLQSSQQLAPCYAAKTLLTDDHNLSSQGSSGRSPKPAKSFCRSSRAVAASGPERIAVEPVGELLTLISAARKLRLLSVPLVLSPLPHPHRGTTRYGEYFRLP